MKIYTEPQLRWKFTLRRLLVITTVVAIGCSLFHRFLIAFFSFNWIIWSDFVVPITAPFYVLMGWDIDTLRDYEGVSVGLGVIFSMMLHTFAAIGSYHLIKWAWIWSELPDVVKKK